ncbi:MAG: hypothetical protein ACYTAF_06085 [Planctomycetota bacterium]|jgi:hypothetical protein
MRPRRGSPRRGGSHGTGRGERGGRGAGGRGTGRRDSGRDTGRGRYPVAAKKDNTPIIIGASVGGFILLIIIIAAAASGGGSTPRKKKKYAPPPPPPKVERSVHVPTTGRIVYRCTNSSEHEDLEDTIEICPLCGRQSKFDGNFQCTSCSKDVRAAVRCKTCGGKPSGRLHIKPF